MRCDRWYMPTILRRARQIATLETEAGTRLVDRTARGVRLTPAGELLVEHAEAILGRLAAESQLEALAQTDAGRLRLGTFPTASATLTPLAIAAFAQEPPLRPAALRGPLARDAAARRRRRARPRARPRHRPGAAGRRGARASDGRSLYLAMPREHPLADADELRMEDLREETWIEGRLCMEGLQRAADAAGFEPRVAFDSSEWLGKQGLVAAGVGVALIPSLGLGAVRDDIVLRELGPDGPSRRVLIATNGCLSPAPAIAPMKAILRRVAEEHCFSCDALVHVAGSTAHRPA